MAAITELLPAEARLRRIPTAEELARTMPPGHAATAGRAGGAMSDERPRPMRTAPGRAEPWLIARPPPPPPPSVRAPGGGPAGPGQAQTRPPGSRWWSRPLRPHPGRRTHPRLRFQRTPGRRKRRRLTFRRRPRRPPAGPPAPPARRPRTGGGTGAAAGRSCSRTRAGPARRPRRSQPSRRRQPSPTLVAPEVPAVEPAAAPAFPGVEAESATAEDPTLMTEAGPEVEPAAHCRLARGLRRSRRRQPTRP